MLRGNLANLWMTNSPRVLRSMARESTTVGTMIRLYCTRVHRSKMLCPECSALQVYADARLERCPHWPRKPSCKRCTIHCYDVSYRAQMRAVMRYAGPRMLFRRPLLAFRHLLTR